MHTKQLKHKLELHLFAKIGGQNIMLMKIKLKKYRSVFFILALICLGVSCASHYYEKELFAWRIPKNQISTLKKVILNEGYRRRSRDDFAYEGAFVTQYIKQLSIANKVNEILIGSPGQIPRRLRRMFQMKTVPIPRCLRRGS
jgi:hypothetical protein